MNELVYKGFLANSDKNTSPYIFVNCNAPPKNMEKIKNNAILYVPNNLKAFNPNFSAKLASSAIKFCGGHFGNVNE